MVFPISKATVNIRSYRYPSQCGNLRIFLPLRFYVKLTSVNSEAQKLPFCRKLQLGNFTFPNLISRKISLTGKLVNNHVVSHFYRRHRSQRTLACFSGITCVVKGNFKKRLQRFFGFSVSYNKSGASLIKKPALVIQRVIKLPTKYHNL